MCCVSVCVHHRQSAASYRASRSNRDEGAAPSCFGGSPRFVSPLSESSRLSTRLPWHSSARAHDNRATTVRTQLGVDRGITPAIRGRTRSGNQPTGTHTRHSVARPGPGPTMQTHVLAPPRWRDVSGHHQKSAPLSHSPWVLGKSEVCLDVRGCGYASRYWRERNEQPSTDQRNGLTETERERESAQETKVNSER